MPAVLAALALALLGAAVWLGLAVREVDRAGGHVSASSAIVAALLDLDQLAVDALQMPGQRPLRQWEIRSADIDRQLAGLDPTAPEAVGLRDDWRQVTALAARLRAAPLSPVQAEVVQDQLLMRTRAMATRATALHRSMLGRASSLSRRIVVVSAVAATALFAAMVVAAVLYLRSARALDAHRAALERANADLARINTELDQFAYAASHDLQEPLRMVSSFLDLLRMREGDRLSDNGRRWLGSAFDGAHRMVLMIRALLDYARTTVGGERAEVDVAAAAREAVENLQELIAAAAAEVEIGALPRVNANRLQLVQVFQNLIGNALKFRGERPPRVRVAAREEDGQWVFTVADNGIGIHEEHRAQLFRLFRRLDPTRAGSGIGLVTCKRVVEDHGGRIWIEPDGGDGATFAFSLPKASVERR